MNISSLQSSYFHAKLPDVVISTSADCINVTIKLDTMTLYDEVLYAVGGAVTLSDLGQLVEPWLTDVLTGTLSFSAVELDSTGTATEVTATASTSVVFGWVDMDVSCSQFCSSHFLTLLNGAKMTAAGRLEYLHFVGSGSGSVVARYSDGSTASFSTTTVAGNSKFTTIDVSPDRFNTTGKTLVKYTVTVGDRSQVFIMDLTEPDCAPILIFTNSFGCQELVYCVGKHEVKPDYTRNSAYMANRRHVYRILEQRKFNADSGVLTNGEVNWIDDLFRSKEIYVVNFVNGVARVGREVVITDSNSEFSNEWDSINRAKFTYMYAQRCHNVMDTMRAGRIFDNTFDNTFD